MPSPTCEFCHEAVAPDRPGTFQWTAGWVECRSAGGGHAIALPEWSPRWAHKACVARLRDGIHPDQGSLL